MAQSVRASPPRHHAATVARCARVTALSLLLGAMVAAADRMSSLALSAASPSSPPLPPPLPSSSAAMASPSSSSSSSSPAAQSTPTVCHFIKPSVQPVTCHHVGFGNQPGSGPGSDAPFVRAPVQVVTTDGCAVLDPLEVGGKIAVLRRGRCAFSTKAVHAFQARAVGIVFVNDRDDHLVARNVMADATDTAAQRLALPIVFVDRTAGAELERVAAAADGRTGGTGQGTTFEIITGAGWASFGSSFNAAQGLVRQGNVAAAVNYFVDAVRINSWDYYSSLTLGQLLYQTGDMTRAKFIFEHTTHVRPRESYSHIVLGSLLSSEGRHVEARQRYEAALAVSDNEAATFNIRLSLATLLPRIMPGPGSAAVDAHLDRVQADLAALAAETTRPITGLQTPTTIPSYLFAYYASGTASDGGRRLYETLGEAMRKIQPALSFVAPHIAGYPARTAAVSIGNGGGGGGGGGARSSRSRIRVGFVSSFFHTHTLMQLFLGVLEGLPRADFEVLIFDISARPADDVTRRVQRVASEYVKLPQIDVAGLAAVQAELAARELDVLVFNDIGLSQHTWFLAFGRFAPVQCLTLSNGMTSGLPTTMDYYVSTQASQPDTEAQAKYSEALVLLDSLYFHLDDPLGPQSSSASYSSSSATAATREYFQRMQQFEFAQVTKAGLRRRWGLPPNSNLYFCFQGLFKLHPTFDNTLFEVLRRDPEAVVVFMHDPKKESWTELLRSRLRQSAAALATGDSANPAADSAVALTALANGRVHFADKLPHSEYLKVMLAADVHLDPFPFGGGLTTAELLGLHLPVVTLPGRHRSGRLTAAMYAKMGVTDLVAHNVSHYAQLAVRTCTDETWRRGVLGRIAATRDVLFSDESHHETVDQWATFLTRAVHQARRGSPALLPPAATAKKANELQQPPPPQEDEDEDEEEEVQSPAAARHTAAVVAAALGVLPSSPPTASVVDFLSPTPVLCDVLGRLRLRATAAGAAAAVLRATRLAPDAAGIATAAETAAAQCAAVSVVVRPYDPLTSPHPAPEATFDLALCLDGARLVALFAGGAGSGDAMVFLSHLFSSSRHAVVLQLPEGLSLPAALGLDDDAGVLGEGDRGRRRRHGHMYGVLQLIHRSFPRWGLASVTTTPTGGSGDALTCVFEKLLPSAWPHGASSSSSSSSPSSSPSSSSLLPPPSSSSLLAAYGREPRLRLDVAAVLGGRPFVVLRDAGEWSLAAAARACSRPFVPHSNYSSGNKNDIGSHHGVPALPLDVAGCATRVHSLLVADDWDGSASVTASVDADAAATAAAACSDGSCESTVSAAVPGGDAAAHAADAIPATAQARAQAQCTLVVPVYKRLSTLPAFLRHYQALPWLRAAVVVWNNPDADPPANAAVFAGVTEMEVVVARQARNSLNNRYTVAREFVRTPCVLAVDDDDLFDLDELTLLKQAWDLVPERIVGLSTYQRTHLWSVQQGAYEYSLVMGTGMPASLLLNSGTVYSAGFHALYAAPAARAGRGVVNSLMNGEDVLFNFVVVNATGLPPLIVKSATTVRSVDKAAAASAQPALSARTEHFADRSRLFNTFATFFNGGAGASHNDTGDSPQQLGSAPAGAVLPRYTSVVASSRIRDAVRGHLSVGELLEGVDRTAGTALYQFTADGSTLRLPNGALYSTVVADHANLRLNLKTTPQTAPVADSAQFAHWVAVEPTPQ